MLYLLLLGLASMFTILYKRFISMCYHSSSFVATLYFILQFIHSSVKGQVDSSQFLLVQVYTIDIFVLMHGSDMHVPEFLSSGEKLLSYRMFTQDVFNFTENARLFSKTLRQLTFRQLCLSVGRLFFLLFTHAVCSWPRCLSYLSVMSRNVTFGVRLCESCLHHCIASPPMSK